MLISFFPLSQAAHTHTHTHICIAHLCDMTVSVLFNAVTALGHRNFRETLKNLTKNMCFLR